MLISSRDTVESSVIKGVKFAVIEAVGFLEYQVTDSHSNAIT